MLNLLKFRERAKYAQAVENPNCTGREAYQRYIAAAGKSIENAAGKLLWYGTVGGLLIGGQDDDGDEILIVEYENGGHLMLMCGDPD